MINKQNNQKACPTVFRKDELRRGFTLLETLVAISIITLTIVGPLAMAAQSAKLISVAKNQLIATYLAQEAMEYVRYARDSNMIQKTREATDLTDYDWLRGVYSLNAAGECDNTKGPCPPQGKLFVCMDGVENSCYLNVSGDFRSCSPSIDVDANCNCSDSGASCYNNIDTLNKALLWKHTPTNGSDGDGYVVREGYPLTDLTPTSFRRYIQISPIDGEFVGEEIAAKVVVKVQWTDTYGPKTLYTQENIYKYR